MTGKLVIESGYGGPDESFLDDVRSRVKKEAIQRRQDQIESLPCPSCEKTEFTGYPGNASDISCDTCDDSGRVTVCCSGEERCSRCKNLGGLRPVWPSQLKIVEEKKAAETQLEAIGRYLRYGRGELVIAIQKDGRLSSLSWGLLQACVSAAGLLLPERNPQDRRMIYPIIGGPDARIITVRNADIPKLVETGVARFGIVGEDQVIEQGANVSIEERLGSAQSSLTALVKKDSPIKTIRELSGKTIATSFPRTVERCLTTLGVEPEKIDQFKSIEALVGAGIYDAGFDLMETGETARMNGADPIARMRTFEAVVIKNKR